MRVDKRKPPLRGNRGGRIFGYPADDEIGPTNELAHPVPFGEPEQGHGDGAYGGPVLGRDD